jgi:Sigma-70, region 4
VARNYCIDVQRRRQRFGSALVTLAATTDSTAESVESVEDRELLLAVLRELGVRDRQALWQSAVEARPLPEIARSFGLSYMAAAKLVSRARQRALVLATRLAVILGLAQLGRAVRRANWVEKGQQVAAIAGVPVVVALVVVSSSSPPPPVGAQAAMVVNLPTIGHRPPHAGQLPGTGPSPAPSPEVAVVTQTSGVEAAVVQVAPAPVAVAPAPAGTVLGSGRHRHGHGKALGHDKTHGLGKALGHHK